ncbi:MAG: copper chaperone PCu(A)C [Gammaproteobacteria bacterium]|nr:copper chaperone PCu(A)C [Gammaproteobacteria bacterium]MCW8928153.1 copper chaperone PCu(A)C [Gammaproteobacteria bacterium]MCW8993520.1 copper chaperone PCu(A)C [Gammaproteobacteria bacterium]
MKRGVAHLALFLLIAVWSAFAPAAEGIMVEDAWIRQAPPGATALAGYMTLHNHSDRERLLVGANSPLFGKVMLHRTVMEEGIASMVHQPLIPIPAGGKVIFKPNDFHIMLMKPLQALRAGDQVEVTLEFKNGETLSVSYEVRGKDELMDGDHSHKGH